jgi:hypothetical protein
MKKRIALTILVVAGWLWGAFSVKYDCFGPTFFDDPLIVDDELAKAYQQVIAQFNFLQPVVHQHPEGKSK